MATETETAILDYLKTDLLYDKEVSLLGAEDPLIDSGLLESLEILQVVSFCEGNFGVAIPDEDVVPETFENVSTIAKLVERLRK